MQKTIVTWLEAYDTIGKVVGDIEESIRMGSPVTTICLEDAEKVKSFIRSIKEDK